MLPSSTTIARLERVRQFIVVDDGKASEDQFMELREALDTVIPRNIRLSEAPSHGVPVNIYDPRSRGSEAYRSLARELAERFSLEPSRSASRAAA